MALNTYKLRNSRKAIAVTGYASQVPEKGVDELYAFMAIALDSKIIHTHKLLTKENSPAEAQKDYVQQVITEALAYFTKL